MNKDNASELFPIVDESGNVIGKATRGECHGGTKLLHPVVHLHVFNKNGELFLQRRPEWKDIQPGKWDTAVGGHVDYGEEVIHALMREAREELSLSEFSPEFMATYIFESDREREFVNSYRAVVDRLPIPTDELDGGRFWKISEILENLGRNVFTPNFEFEFTKLFITK